MLMIPPLPWFLTWCAFLVLRSLTLCTQDLSLCGVHCLSEGKAVQMLNRQVLQVDTRGLKSIRGSSCRESSCSTLEPLQHNPAPPTSLAGCRNQPLVWLVARALRAPQSFRRWQVDTCWLNSFCSPFVSKRARREKLSRC